MNRCGSQKLVGLVERDGGRPRTLPPVVQDLAHGDFPEPGPERSLPLPLEAGDLAEDDHENLMGQVGRLIPEAGNATEPALDQRQVDPLQPVPVGRFRPGHLESNE
jgi:hypothetical protein